ncbi:MAG: fibrobacter succinogenes major paralogous domain-containing protein, partial [Candidatus Symbiothrix sp.]|nr:fibrobacter succinogenes major paralogous domain-containing protein [Candidatus Symbiothrix sp.]
SNTDVAVVSDKGVVSPVADGEAEITVSFGGITSDPVAVTITTPICGSPFTAPSGETYTTANYNNTGLTNLCWTTSNLQEAGQSATCYSNNCDTYSGRGYYYTFENAKTACGALTDSNGTWRLPTTTEWKSLISAYPNLAGGEGTFGSSADLKLLWGAPELRNGHYCPAVYGWGYIDGNGYWWGSTANTETVVTNSTGILWYGPDSRVATQWDQVRCVRDI